MSLALGQNPSAHLGGSNVTVTTTGVTTASSGSGFIVMAVGKGGAPSAGAVTDSKSNTYTQIGSTVNYNFTGTWVSYWRCYSGTGGASHTFTYTQGGFADASIFVQEITTAGAGLAADNVSVATNTDGATPFTSNGLTTTAANTAIISFLAGASGSNPATHTVSGGALAITANQTNGSGGDCTGALAAAVVSSTQTALVASFTETGNSPEAVAWIASFSEAGASSPAIGSQTATFSQGTFTANTPAAPISAPPLPPLLASKALGPFGLGGFVLRVFPQTAANPNVSAALGAQTATFSQGTFTASSTGGAAMGSQTATFSQGTFAGSSTGTGTLGAQTATFSQGTFTASTSGGGSVSIGSQTATFTQGGFSIAGAYTALNYRLTSRFAVNPDGKTVIVPSGSATTPYTYVNGFKIDSNGRIVTTPVSGGIWQNGLPFDGNGNLFITSSPITPKTYLNSLCLDGNGALAVSFGSIAYTENGLAFDSNGYLVVVNG